MSIARPDQSDGAPPAKPLRLAAAGLLAIYLATLVYLTLYIFPGDNPPPNLVPFRSMAHDLRLGGRALLVNFVGNIAAFLPLGVLGPVVRSRPTGLGRVVAWAVLLSGSIEAAQYLSGRRTADVDDVILNALGGVLGFGALMGCRALITRRRRP